MAAALAELADDCTICALKEQTFANRWPLDQLAI
jgi:hypothetical protein